MVEKGRCVCRWAACCITCGGDWLWVETAFGEPSGEDDNDGYRADTHRIEGGDYQMYLRMEKFG